MTAAVRGEKCINEKFFDLPQEKQQAILNAGYRVFSQNAYKKCPVSEIAAEAGISKSLLFYYFRNKQELYLFLWDTCAEITMRSLTEARCYEQTDLFEMLQRGLKAKVQIMRQYPYIGTFCLKAFYERDPEISRKIRESCTRFMSLKAHGALERLDPEHFTPGLDLKVMYRQMYLATEGYLWEMLQRGQVDVEKMERDFTEMIAFWKKIYLRNGGET